MVNRINDIAWQAHQGSIAAIIQLLNQNLAQSGVRTRAIFDNGVLQLLCEAHTVDQLEKSILVKQIQLILEPIAPRNIRRVNINSRIVQEQQLLWLEEIRSDPKHNLLWSEAIYLAKPHIFKQLVEQFKEHKNNNEVKKLSIPKSQLCYRSVVAKKNKFQTSLVTEMLGAASLCLFLLSLGWSAHIVQSDFLKYSLEAETIKSLTPATIDQQETYSMAVAPNKSLSEVSNDAFVAAVRIANYASANGKIAKTPVEWLDIAARWQRASELMSTVPPTHSRYEEAKIRTQLYKKYSEEAHKEANKR
jgi:hypothetical protein